MEFRVLGPLEVVEGDRAISLPGGRARALLALLILNNGQAVSTDRLIDELWGATPPPTANKSLQNLVSELRRRLGSVGEDGLGVLVTSDPGYELSISPDQVDANRFRTLLDEAADAPVAERAVGLRTALDLWRGPALADFTYEPFAQREIAVLDELRMKAIEERVDADLILGRHAELVGELKGLVADHPLRERLRAQLMLALYRCGRQADALEEYRVGRRTLIEELGIEPGPALSGLERAILRQDPALEASADGGTEASGVEQRVGAEALLTAERRTVTVLYVDLADSTTQADPRPDAEVVHRLLGRSINAVTKVVVQHGGTVEGVIGGVLVGVFGIPAAHEDDALRAVRAALEVRRSVVELNSEVERGLGVRLLTRIGVNTGEVIVGEASGPTVTSGDTARLAGRLQEAAGDDQVLLGETTKRLLGTAIQVELMPTLILDRRGRPTTAWRLIGSNLDVSVRTARRDRPLVGRSAELARLYAAFQRTIRQRRSELLTVIGEPGIGKSRLAVQFTESLSPEGRVLVGRCLAYGDGITFWPLREILEEAVGEHGLDGLTALLDEDDAESIAARIAGAVGIADRSASGRELFPDLRRLFEAMAERQPLVVVVDDAHWAQPTLLDLLSYLGDRVHAPMLIVCLARPEFLEERTVWTTGPSEAASLILEPLNPADSERLVTQWLAGRIVSDEVVAKVVEVAQGNPLFIEQLLAAFHDQQELLLPPSVHALLAARLDRLGPAERDVLRRASVIGVDFSLEALSALVPPEARAFVQRHLHALEDKELISPSQRRFLGSAARSFRHALIQTAAYRSITRGDRADLHERFVEWLDTEAPRGTPELDELAGHHLEQAHAERRLLGLADEATRGLAVRAGERLTRAGLRAYQGFDMTAAESLLSRARALLPADHPERYEVLRRLSEAYPTLGRLSDAEAVLAEMFQHRSVEEDACLRERLRLERLRVRLIAGPDPVRHEAIRSEVVEALKVLEPMDDHVGMSQACYLLATMHQRSGEMRELLEIGRCGLEHARRSGDLREQLGALWWPAWALVAGPTPVPEAIATCEELLEIGREAHPALMTDLARLRAMVGEVDAARELAAQARSEVVERIRVRRALTVVSQRSAEVEVLAGNLDSAERTLRSAIVVALDVGERDQTAQIAAELSRLLSARGHVEEAATFADLSRGQAPGESVTAQALWRAATARAIAGTEIAEAKRLAQEAITLVPDEMLNLRADLHLDLAEIQLAAGEGSVAVPVAADAVALYERKGNTVGAGRAAELVEQLAGRPR